MSTSLRQQHILRLLEEEGSVSVRALTAALYVSEATVRRDLAELERAGALRRTFGGAMPILETTKQVPLFIRSALDADAKSEICSRAAALIADGSTVFIDGSSTAQHLVRYLAEKKDITAVTYSIKTAELLCESHIKTYCAGGLLLENSLVCTGQRAVLFAKEFNTDIAFFSCKGMSETGLFTDTSEEETAVRRTFMENARMRVMLMTGGKLGRVYLHTLCHADEVDRIFSDIPLPCSCEAGRNKS